MSMLCRLGANPQFQTRSGRTALMSAADAATIPALVEGGAICDFETKHGTTALIEASRDGKVSSWRFEQNSVRELHSRLT